jgi:hypothetical protein
MAEAIPTMDFFVLQLSQKISFLSSDQNKKETPEPMEKHSHRFRGNGQP